MKKFTILSIFILATITSLVIYSCTKVNESKKEFINTEYLSKDKVFIELVNDMYNFVSVLDKTIKNKSLSITEIQLHLSRLQEKNKNTSEQFTEIDKIFKESISSTLNSHMVLFYKNWKIINNKYGNISSEILQKECLEVFEDRSQILKKNDTNNNYVTLSNEVIVNSDCGWRYYLCGAAATGGAIACHAAIDVPTVGLGAPAAIAICGTAQVYALVVCHDTYCK